jgi:hypothetical protein
VFDIEDTGSEEVMSFSWDDVYGRRRVLAGSIARRLGLSFGFLVEEPFCALRLSDQMLADKPMRRVPFYVIAHRMQEETPSVIDHAWWLMADDRSGEPWGFVTEPYMTVEAVGRLAARVKRFEDWGISVRVLPKQDSAWYPGGAVPIVTTVGVGWLSEFLRYGVGAALELMWEGER